MINRTTAMVHADTNETLYKSVCTIDGNKITGSLNPFPYIKRIMKRKGLRPVKMFEDGQNVTIYVA